MGGKQLYKHPFCLFISSHEIKKQYLSMEPLAPLSATSLGKTQKHNHKILPLHRSVRLSRNKNPFAWNTWHSFLQHPLSFYKTQPQNFVKTFAVKHKPDHWNGDLSSHWESIQLMFAFCLVSSDHSDHTDKWNNLWCFLCTHVCLHC